MSHRAKGDLLEHLVAMLHEMPGIDVIRKAKLAPVHDPAGSKREIDVLICGKLAGFPLRIAIECKNWAEAVGVEVVDGFIGKLGLIGIPAQLGVIVSPNGYTDPAKQAAKLAGVRLLEFEGMTPDGLGQVVADAYQSVVYLTLEWVQLSMFPILPLQEGRPGIPGSILIENKRHAGEADIAWTLRSLWEAWNGGKFPPTIQEHVAVVCAPVTHQHSDPFIIVDLVVHGHVLEVSGTVMVSKLKDAFTGQIDKLRLDAVFDSGEEVLQTKRVDSEAQLRERSQKGVIYLDRGRVRVPRIAMQAGWFPPSARALARIVELRRAGEEPTFEQVEGRDLRRAWEEPTPQRSSEHG